MQKNRRKCLSLNCGAATLLHQTPRTTMDFARKQLEKYGWTDGKGLGKNENGISEALKPKLKRSVAGIGHDAAADFTEHWWTTLYNKAASNVQVEEKNGKTRKIKTKDDKFKITNSTWKLNNKSKTSDQGDEYSEYFVRKAVLTSGGCKTERLNDDSESEEEVKETKDITKMTDEELFAACGGRTAHKGARHGLKATGKLARIERQEQNLLSQPQYDGYSHTKMNNNKNFTVKDLVIEDVSLNSDTDGSDKKKKKKKRKRCISRENNNSTAHNICQEKETTENMNISEDRTDGTLDGLENDNEIQNEEVTVKKLKKSKRKVIELNGEEDGVEDKKQKKSKNSEISEEMELFGHVCEDSDVSMAKEKKTKKKKLKTSSCT